MQYIEGKNLRSVMKAEGMSLIHVANIIRQIGQALTSAHDRGIYHRDLKPENIMLQAMGEDEDHVKLIDFGVATVKDSQVASNRATTMVAGTVGYMAPEQLIGKPSAASDIYALGVIAYASASAQVMQARSQVELAIIVNKSNPNDNLSFSELREYFMAERNNWSSGAGKVRVIMRKAGDPERETVLRLIYDMDEKDFNSYFLGKKFRGEILEEPRLRSSTPDMIKTISTVPGAIGYVRVDEVDASVKVIRVDGLAPGDAGYRIRQ